MKPQSIVIEKRFCGPPNSGNGGYVAGRLAAYIEGPAKVRLEMPPPLDAALDVRRDGERVLLMDGAAVVARAEPVSGVVFAPPPPPTFAAAAVASERYVGFTNHVFPTCFVCGPRRESGDGLRIFPGRLDGPREVACPWIPDASLAGADGEVASEFLWAALDCPGGFSFPAMPATPVVLGELAVEIHGSVAVGERCVLLAKELAHRGRKHETATVLYGEAGDCRAVGLATWIELATASSVRG